MAGGKGAKKYEHNNFDKINGSGVPENPVSEVLHSTHHLLIVQIRNSYKIRHLLAHHNEQTYKFKNYHPISLWLSLSKFIDRSCPGSQQEYSAQCYQVRNHYYMLNCFDYFNFIYQLFVFTFSEYFWGLVYTRTSFKLIYKYFF